ncbi:SPOR domain-containing protein [Sphingomonas sp. KR1UV-12]|uniref:SPOR domain-containing protein n=1 Tax=Sphingomonas aurea TaxID=3063994 RepID=A0ABT9EFI4_9SPHN|nr:SPOR domain-containing protein [Sphingomonas sp. KR1UV-12]MDP1025639.1 SPOR domain-containing protein [Sphingomonas sp. KR1UV-12]
MTHPTRLTSLLAALAMTALPMPLAAQAVVQSLEQTDADLLAAQMRQLATNPRDVTALVSAGDLSLKLGDLSGAAALYARADKIDPRDGRVKAGMASILVRSERPGEALRLFQQAEQAGLSTAAFAADRGLAYDLIGQQERAQRDYRTALGAARADETVRRYALSLGISGRQAEALDLLDPLVRRQDRAAWRARAFILAMNGDTAGANKIATTMMPAQLAQGLGLFFTRLPALSPVDRAFAVHFGEVYPTPERIADAKLVPPMAALPGETRPPVQVAAATPVPTAREQRSAARRRSTPTRATPPVQVAAAQATPVRTVAPTAAPVVTPAPVRTAPAIVMAPAREVVQTVPAAPVRQTPPVTVAAVTPRPAPATSVPPVESNAATRRADAVLARIVASLTIPASELGVGEPQGSTEAIPAAVARAPASAAGKRVVAGASEKEARDTAVRRAVAAKLTGDADADDPAPATTAKGKRGVKAVAALEEPVLTPAQKRAADRKAKAEKQAAADKKALADKAAAEKKAARANPSRIWVQVASGANENDLVKAWKAAKAKSPASFAGKSGYTTPLRATNRVLTGPFKTDAEARAFVNTLAKEGVSSYATTSEAGQPVTRLPAK